MKPVLKFNAGTREINPTVTPTTRKPLIRWDSPATTVWILLTTKKVYLYRLWTTFRNNTNRNHIRLEIVMDAFKLKTLLRPCVHQSVFPAAGVFFQLFSMGARWYSLSSFRAPKISWTHTDRAAGPSLLSSAWFNHPPPKARTRTSTLHCVNILVRNKLSTKSDTSNSLADIPNHSNQSVSSARWRFERFKNFFYHFTKQLFQLIQSCEKLRFFLPSLLQSKRSPFKHTVSSMQF